MFPVNDLSVSEVVGGITNWNKLENYFKWMHWWAQLENRCTARQCLFAQIRSKNVFPNFNTNFHLLYGLAHFDTTGFLNKNFQRELVTNIRENCVFQQIDMVFELFCFEVFFTYKTNYFHFGRPDEIISFWTEKSMWNHLPYHHYSLLFL